jgi:hypothetical protein
MFKNVGIMQDYVENMANHLLNFKEDQDWVTLQLVLTELHAQKQETLLQQHHEAGTRASMDALLESIVEKDYAKDGGLQEMFGEDLESLQNLNRMILGSGAIRQFIDERAEQKFRRSRVGSLTSASRSDFQLKPEDYTLSDVAYVLAANKAQQREDIAHVLTELSVFPYSIDFMNISRDEGVPSDFTVILDQNQNSRYSLFQQEIMKDKMQASFGEGVKVDFIGEDLFQKHAHLF